MCATVSSSERETKVREQLADRFWRFVDADGPDGCWEWTGGRLPKGYGNIWDGEKLSRAHRVSYELFRGAIPQGMQVLHSCDNPPCTNPGHLFLGTNADNLADRVAKGRSASGERHGNAKLTTAQVLAIRADQRHFRTIAKEYGIFPNYVHQIKSRAWRRAS